MAQMKKLETVVKNLRLLADSLEELSSPFRLETVEKVPEEVEKAASPTVTIEDIRKVLAEVRDLLQQYGANKLSAVEQKHYPSLLEDAKGL